MSDLIPPADPNVEHNTKKPYSLSNSLFLDPATANEVETLIDQLSNQKNKRQLDIETKFIKLSKYVISTPLSEVFNLCVTQGTFPTYLKIAEVIPVFKKGDKQMASNYRPISILSQFEKIFEKMLCNRISDYQDRYKLLNQNQFGFRKHLSTTHAVSYIHKKLLQNVDKNGYSCCVFLDLSKAFDTVNHEILLYKLEGHFGVRGKL